MDIPTKQEIAEQAVKRQAILHKEACDKFAAKLIDSIKVVSWEGDFQVAMSYTHCLTDYIPQLAVELRAAGYKVIIRNNNTVKDIWVSWRPETAQDVINKRNQELREEAMRKAL